MPYLAKKTELGKLEMRDIYIHYDIPRLFSCVNEYNQIFLALSIGETETEFRWLYVAVSSKRLASITSGEVDLKDAFRETEDGSILLVSITENGDKVQPGLPSEIADSELPIPGQRLCLPKKHKSGNPVVKYVGDTDIIEQAFKDVRELFSVDKVIADPRINAKYVKRCEELGLLQPAFQLNHTLMRMRKAGRLSGLESQAFKIDGNISSRIDYACELAWRYLTMTKGVSLDDILCDPNLAKEFDKLARLMSPGYESIHYRWAALQVRKSRRRIKENLELCDNLTFESPKRITSIRKSDVPNSGGIYLFLYDQHPLFLSQTDSLRQRVEMHLEYTSGRGLPEWIWLPNKRNIEVSFAPLPDIVKTKRQGMEVNQVILQKPIFNVQPGHAA